MSSPAYRGRHRAPAGRHRAAGDAFRPDRTARPTTSLTPRRAGAGYLLPAAAAATLALTATGAHLGGAVSGSGGASAASTSGAGAAAMLTASGLATSDPLQADPIQRSTQDRAARSAVRGPATVTGTAGASGTSGTSASGAGDGATDATPSSTEEQAKYDAEAAGAAKMQGEANAAAQAQADAAQAQAAADAQAKAQADAAAQAHAWVKFIDGGYDLTSGFGMRWGSMHPGQDFAVPVGTPVKAMSAGTVVFAGWQGGYGNKVEIKYWDGTVSWFAHNSKLLVAQGDTVTPGEVVSLSGNTGHSTGPHIHVEIHPAGGDPVPPIPWLTKMGTMP